MDAGATIVSLTPSLSQRETAREVWSALRTIFIASTCLVLVGSLLDAPVRAEVYKWVDENGKTHYSQHAPSVTQSEEMQLRKSPAGPRDDTMAKLRQRVKAIEDAELENEKAEQE